MPVRPPGPLDEVIADLLDARSDVQRVMVHMPRRNGRTAIWSNLIRTLSSIIQEEETCSQQSSSL